MTENGEKNVDPAAAEGDPLISILIVSRDRRRHLETLVARLKDMDTRHRYEIVVVEETDRPEPFEGVTYVPHPVADLGIPYARNLALANATGELVVFIDDDCTVPDQWLNRLLTPFQNARVVGVQGGVTVPPDTNPVGWAETILGFPGGGVKRVLESKGRTIETKEVSTLNCAYRKWVIEEIGGFDERLKLGAEDYILAKEACTYGQCLFVPDAIVAHESRGSFLKIWKWFVRRGRSDIKAQRTRSSNEYALSMVLKSSVGLKVCGLFIACLIFDTSLLVLLPAALLSYAGLQYIRHFKAWKETRTSFKTLCVISPVKLLMDIAMDWGRVKGLLLG